MAGGGLRRLRAQLHAALLSLTPLKAEESDVRNVHAMLAVDSDKPVILERDHHITDRSDVDEWCARTQTDFSFPTTGSQVVHVIRVEHAVLTARDVNQDSIEGHDVVVARLGRYAHGLVAHRMSWCCGG